MDSVLFWMVWDAKKACLEVENYYNSVSLAAQTALRDAIGRASVSEVAIRRNQLDQELQEVIEERTSVWGITVLSVEIRDIVIPQGLQEVMSAEAQAEREKNARMVLAEVEKDISAMLVDAANVYEENELAVRLRTMHLLDWLHFMGHFHEGLRYTRKEVPGWRIRGALGSSARSSSGRSCSSTTTASPSARLGRSTI